MSDDEKDLPTELPEPEGDVPEAHTDPSPPRAPGGADASVNESDVGAGSDPDALAVPDQPLSAQTEEESVPDEIQEPEESDPAPAEGQDGGDGGEGGPSEQTG